MLDVVFLICAMPQQFRARCSICGAQSYALARRVAEDGRQGAAKRSSAARVEFGAESGHGIFGTCQHVSGRRLARKHGTFWYTNTKYEARSGCDWPQVLYPRLPSPSSAADDIPTCEIARDSGPSVCSAHVKGTTNQISVIVLLAVISHVNYKYAFFSVGTAKPQASRPLSKESRPT